MNNELKFLDGSNIRFANDGIDEEIDDSFPPLVPTTHVRTTDSKEDYKSDLDLWGLIKDTQVCGITGIVLGPMQGYEQWYQVLHDKDGEIGYYHYSELEIISCDDRDDDNNRGDSDDGGGDIDPPTSPHEIFTADEDSKHALSLQLV